MRRKILGVAVLAAALAVLLFGLPLAYVVQKLYVFDERRELDRAALRTALQATAALPNLTSAAPSPEVETDIRAGVYAPDGARRAGRGPDLADEVVRAALGGAVADRTTGGEIVVAVPVYDGNRVVGAARAATSLGEQRRQVYVVWGGMAGLAAVAGLASFGLAARQSRRVARPLVRLEEVAEELGGGNFAVRAEPCGISEIDRAGAALNRTAERLDDILARERAFTAVASHQLRTPLTTMRLGLEQALEGPDDALRAAAREALAGTDRLSATIDDVLDVARGGAGEGAPVALAPVLARTEARWAGVLGGLGRGLRVVDSGAPATTAAVAAVRQILDILVDNAVRHGRGTVTLVARESAGAVAIDVVDEGHADGALVPPAPAPGRPRRLGLALAASLAAAEGGRLVHARTDPTTRLTVLLPAAAGD